MVKPECGALQGTTGAVDIFQDSVSSCGGLLAATGGIPGLPESRDFLNLSITSNADDVAKGKLFKDGQELQQMVLAGDMALSDSLQRRLWSSAHWQAKTHCEHARSGLLTGRVATSIKYLGCWLHREGRQAQEITSRINAVTSGWFFGTNLALPNERPSWCSKV